METAKIEQILSRITNVKIAVYGDFCLDAYWILHPDGGEVSVETGINAQAVKKHYYSLGGASNVAANLVALNPAKICAIGVVGNDIFGRELAHQLKEIGVETGSLVVQEEYFDTYVFGKRYISDNEKARIDFGFFNQRSKETDKQILQHLQKAFQDYDVLIFNQQVPGSIGNEDFLQKVNQLFSKFEDKIALLDSRHYGNKFENVYLKTNDIEAARLNGIEANTADIIALEDVKSYAEKLYDNSNKPVFVTRGSRGILVVDSQGIHEIPGIQSFKKTDTVGAGDTTTSALAASLAAGFNPAEAAEFANYAAAVTVQKLFQTGTASPQEIIQIAEDADYIYQPELAEDIRKAHYIETTDIELCYDITSIAMGCIKHCVFDHDGTISTLRQGWEEIMEPVMVKAILGPTYETADETLYHEVLNRVHDYIDKSTGIQTILQMDSLVEMVKEFGLVSKDDILDKFGYKQIYNDALMEMVNQRLARFQNGQLDINDFTVKGAVSFLNALKQKGIKLYLASGTDIEDVKNEAAVFGYAELFDGGIYGAVGDVSKCSKKMVIEKIMRENNLQGSQLAVFGDGPVEIRECRKRKGIAIGIASDEIRRHGLNLEKRTRLIKAGAHIVVPDFSQFEKLTNLLLENS